MTPPPLARSSRQILTIGSINADLVVRVPHFPDAGETILGDSFERFPGGKGANQAFGVARLGGQSRMVGLVGTDSHGDWLLHHLESGGVDVSAVGRTSAFPTGVALITIDASGQNHIVVVAGANAAVLPSAALEAVGAVDPAIVLLQLEVPLETVSAAAESARDAGALVILDPAPARELPGSLLSAVDVLTPNEPELLALTGGGSFSNEEDVALRARRLLAAGARHVIVKRGASGATLVTEAGIRHWPAPHVAVVDTTAAGDAFNAALAVGLVEGHPLVEAVPYAIAAASLSVTRAGAQTSLPTREEVSRSLE